MDLHLGIPRTPQADPTPTATAFDGAGKKGSGGACITVDQPPTWISPARGRGSRKGAGDHRHLSERRHQGGVVDSLSTVSASAPTPTPRRMELQLEHPRRRQWSPHHPRLGAGQQRREGRRNPSRSPLTTTWHPTQPLRAPAVGQPIYGVGIVQIAADRNRRGRCRPGRVLRRRNIHWRRRHLVERLDGSLERSPGNYWIAYDPRGGHRHTRPDCSRHQPGDHPGLHNADHLAPASTTTVTFVEVDTPAEGLSATAFSLEPPTVSAGGEIALTVALAPKRPAKPTCSSSSTESPLAMWPRLTRSKRPKRQQLQPSSLEHSQPVCRWVCIALKP